MKNNKNMPNIDTKNALIRVILENNQSKTTYVKLAKAMQEYGFKSYGLQTARADLSKLGIVKSRDTKKKPILLYLALERAEKKAKQRGMDGGRGYKILQASKIPMPVVDQIIIENKIREIFEDPINLEFNYTIRKNVLIDLLNIKFKIEKSKSEAVIENMIEDCYLFEYPDFNNYVFYNKWSEEIYG